MARMKHTLALSSSGSTDLQDQDLERRRSDRDSGIRGQGGERSESEVARWRVPASTLPHSHAPRPGLTEGEERQLMLRLEELARIEGLREDRTRIKVSSATQALIDSRADDSEVLKKDGSVVLEGPLAFKELSADPDDPDEGHAVMWLDK